MQQFHQDSFAQHKVLASPGFSPQTYGENRQGNNSVPHGKEVDILASPVHLDLCVHVWTARVVSPARQSRTSATSLRSRVEALEANVFPWG